VLELNHPVVRLASSYCLTWNAKKGACRWSVDKRVLITWHPVTLNDHRGNAVLCQSMQLWPKCAG